MEIGHFSAAVSIPVSLLQIPGYEEAVTMFQDPGTSFVTWETFVVVMAS